MNTLTIAKRWWIMGLVALLALALAFVAIGPDTPNAKADHAPPEGTLLRDLVIPGSAGVGVGFDGTHLYWMDFGGATLHKIQTDGTPVADIPIVGCTATVISWDASRTVFWGAAGTQISQITTAGACTPWFNVAGFLPGNCDNGFGCSSLIDGINHDPSDDSIWYSPDGSQRVYHYDIPAAPIAGALPHAFPFFDVNDPPNDMILECGFNYSSGVATGVDPNIIYLAADGCDTIFRYDKQTGAKVSSFVIGAQRHEDMECDNVTFADQHTDAVWIKDAFDNHIRAFAVPQDTCVIVPELTLDPPEDTNDAGTSHTVTATISPPLVGVKVSFSVTAGPNKDQVSDPNTGECTPNDCKTDANGQVSWTYTSNGQLGTDTIQACLPEFAAVQCATATKTWTPGAPATLTLSPKTDTNTVDAEHCVTATVKDAFGNPTPGITVQFQVTGSVNTSGSAVTDANGQATFCYPGPALPGADVITAFADTNNNGVQDSGEPSDTAAKTWVIPAPTAGCKVTYGGRITAANGDKATFGGNATAPDKGQEEYQDHGPAQPRNVHSINVQSVVCSADKTQVSIFGEATIDGAGTFNYRIDMKDLGEPGKTDTYRIRLSDGYDSGEQVLDQGNVQIHK